MNTKLIAGLVVAGIVIVGGIFAFANRSSNDGDNESNANTNNTTQQQTAETINESGFPNQILQGDQSYVATVKTTDSADPANNAEITLIYDSANLWSADVTAGEGNIKTIFSGDASYVSNQGGAWTKFPLTSENGSTSIEGYTFSDSDIDDFRKYAKNLGKESCSLGTCDVWEVTDNQEGTNGKVWLASDGRMARGIITDGTMTTEINYDYNADTSVEIPKDFQEINFPTDGEIDLEDLESLLPQ